MFPRFELVNGPLSRPPSAASKDAVWARNSSQLPGATSVHGSRTTARSPKAIIATRCRASDRRLEPVLRDQTDKVLWPLEAQPKPVVGIRVCRAARGQPTHAAGLIHQQQDVHAGVRCRALRSRRLPRVAGLMLTGR